MRASRLAEVGGHSDSLGVATDAPKVDQPVDTPAWKALFQDLLTALSTAVLFVQLGLVIIAALLTLLVSHKTIMIAGGSMVPTIPPGDIVVSVAPTQQNVGQGSVVIIREPTQFVTHRVVGIDSDGKLITKGDGNPKPDSDHRSFGDIEGSVRLIVPLVGRPRIWIDHRMWTQFAVWATVTFIAFRIWQRDRDDLFDQDVSVETTAGSDVGVNSR